MTEPTKEQIELARRIANDQWPCCTDWPERDAAYEAALAAIIETEARMTDNNAPATGEPVGVMFWTGTHVQVTIRPDVLENMAGAPETPLYTRPTDAPLDNREITTTPVVCSETASGDNQDAPAPAGEFVDRLRNGPYTISPTTGEIRELAEAADALEAKDARIATLTAERDAAFAKGREAGQGEGFAAAVSWLRDHGAMKPRAALWQEAEMLADMMEQSRIPASALKDKGEG